MPRKVAAHDEKLKKRMEAIGTVEPKHLIRARKYRSSSNWQKVRKSHALTEPLCRDPFGTHALEKTSLPMAEVHHIYPLSTHFALRAYGPNLVSLCHKCHDRVEKMERHGKKTQYLFKK